MMLNRKIAPVNFSFTAPDIPSPEIYTLQNGLVIHSFENDDLDIIKLEFIFKNVNSFTEKVTGINLLTAKTLLAGTKNSSAEQLANQIASLGAFIDVSPSFDYTILNVYCLEKDIIDVINLIKEILENANFSETEVKLQKNIAISNLKLQKKKNSIVASRALRKSLFSNHPYGKSPIIKDIHDVNREQISSSYQRFWKEVDVLVCGKVTNRVLTSLEGLQINKSELNDHH